MTKRNKAVKIAKTMFSAIGALSSSVGVGVPFVSVASFDHGGLYQLVTLAEAHQYELMATGGTLMMVSAAVTIIERGEVFATSVYVVKMSVFVAAFSCLFLVRLPSAMLYLIDRLPPILRWPLAPIRGALYLLAIPDRVDPVNAYRGRISAQRDKGFTGTRGGGGNQATQLAKALASYFPQSSLGRPVIGPNFVFHPVIMSQGARLSSLRSASDDILRSLPASSQFCESPPTGRNPGFLVPRKDRELVKYSDVSRPKKNTGLTASIGLDSIGKPVFVDFASDHTPHLLVAGTTRSGKTVALNTMLCSLICEYKKGDAELVLIDPKGNEFAFYENCKNLRIPPVYDMGKVPALLDELIELMNTRYIELRGTQSRNIDEHRQAGEEMARLVVVIDEVADLMDEQRSAGIDAKIRRLAQKGAAAGIHLIVCTQRPDKDSISNNTKAVLPGYLLFRMRYTDAQTITNNPPAIVEKLLGAGDGLLITQSVETRIQSAYLDKDELIDRLKPHKLMPIEPLDMPEDEIYLRAVDVVRESQKATATHLARALRIGTDRAANLLVEMEERKVIGPSKGRGISRDIYTG